MKAENKTFDIILLLVLVLLIVIGFLAYRTVKTEGVACLTDPLYYTQLKVEKVFNTEAMCFCEYSEEINKIDRFYSRIGRVPLKLNNLNLTLALNQTSRQ